MSPTQALQILYQATGHARLTRAEHQQVVAALDALEAALKPAPASDAAAPVTPSQETKA